MKKKIRSRMIKVVNKILGMRDNTLDAQLSELLWSQRFISTIQNSTWFHNGVTPGGWAVGYPFLCILYRILDEVRPHRILEFGLGQSTKLTSAYMNSGYNDGTMEHIVVEHDPEWVQFMRNSFDLKKTNMLMLSLEEKQYKGFKVTSYKDLNAKNVDGKFDLIIIDAPFGSMHYSRIDTLNIIPDCLESDFIIMVDDYDRQGEKAMCEDLMSILNENGISFSFKIYAGQRAIMVIASQSRRFVCTMN